MLTVLLPDRKLKFLEQQPIEVGQDRSSGPQRLPKGILFSDSLGYTNVCLGI